MPDISFDLSHRADLDHLRIPITRLDATMRELDIEFLIVGATARDLVLLYGCDVSIGRATADLDIAVAVSDWVTYERVTSRFERRRADPPHRVRVADLPIDIVPFGGVERPDRTIAWPPDDGSVMSTFGMAEALAGALLIRLSSDLVCKVASLPAQLTLKLTAWQERGIAKPRHDSVDIRYLLKAYGEAWNFDRLYGEVDLLEKFDFDTEASERIVPISSTECGLRYGRRLSLRNGQCTDNNLVGDLMTSVVSLGIRRPASSSGHFGLLPTLFVLAAALLLVLLVPGVGYAAVTVSRAEVNSGSLRIEGTAAPSRVITVDGVGMGSSSTDGRFRVERSGYTPPADCTVDVNDGSATAVTAALAGCTVSSPPPPSGTCTIVPTTFPDGNVGTLNTWYFGTTGCRTSEQIVQFSVVAGQIPPGTTLFTQGTASGGITGRPTTEGLFSFTIRVKDFTGATDTESFSIRINPPRPLVITNVSDTLSPGTVGQFYCCGNLFADGGVPGYTWSLRSGQLPPGLSLTASPGRITGTPTTAGTFSFLMRVTDSVGSFAERTFSITIS